MGKMIMVPPQDCATQPTFAAVRRATALFAQKVWQRLGKVLSSTHGAMLRHLSSKVRSKMKKQIRARWTMKQVQELSAAKGNPFAKSEAELKSWTTGYHGDVITVTEKPKAGASELSRFSFDPSSGAFTEMKAKRVLGGKPKAAAKTSKKAAGKKAS